MIADRVRAVAVSASWICFVERKRDANIIVRRVTTTISTAAPLMHRERAVDYEQLAILQHERHAILLRAAIRSIDRNIIASTYTDDEAVLDHENLCCRHEVAALDR
jgi:hypothetical protein